MTFRDLRAEAQARIDAGEVGVELPGAAGTVAITLAPAPQSPPFYQVGTLLQVTLDFRDLAGGATEPVEATLHSIAPPEESPPLSVALTQTATGRWVGTVSLEEAGTWWLRATGGSPGPVLEEPVEVELAHV